MVKCTVCGRNIRSQEPVSAVFTLERTRSFYHKRCEGRVEQFEKWREEAPWTFKPSRLRLTEWKRCTFRKHLGVWQSIFISRRDEDIYCPDCGLKIARHEGLTCSSCNGPAIVLGAEQTRMVFTHSEPLHKLRLYCVGKGETSTTYAIINGYTPVAVTTKKKSIEPAEYASSVPMLKYQPKGDPKLGLTV